MKKNVVLIICIVAALAVGFGAGVFAGPYILFRHGGHFSHGAYPNRSLNHSSNSSVHLQYAVDIANKSGIGDYLVNSTGWALYMYVPDVPNSGKSTCYGECASAWPIFYTSNLTVQPGINISMLGTINRTDGTKQLTYNGYPLYYYAYDTGAGNINGHGVGKIWYLMSPQGTIIYNSS